MKRSQAVAIGILAILILSTFVSAFTTLSLSRVDFSSNDPQLNKPAWLLTVVDDGNDQSAVGTFESDQIKRSSDGATAQHDITISIADSKNTCEYAFQSEGTPIYSVEMTRVSWAFYASECEAMPGAWYARRSWFDGYCFTRTKTAGLTPLGTPTNAIESTVKAQVGGETVQGVVTNTGQKSVNLGSRAYASWSGNLVSGSQCPNPLDSGVTGIKRGDEFTVVNKAAYDAYRVDQSDLLSCLSAVDGEANFRSCVTAYNAKTNALLVKTNRAPFSTAVVSGGKASFSLPAAFQYPVITLRVDAAWLGIFIPVGEPKIVSASDVSFIEGSQGVTKVVVKNVGSARGSFNIGVSCDAPADRTGASQVVTVNPGEAKTVELSITGQAGDRTAETSCEVTATDVNNPSNTDSRSFEVTIKPLALCTPGQSRCLDKTIEVCGAEGASWIANQVCPNGCVVEDGAYTCSEPVACDTDKDCDDNDAMTKDQCVGVLETQCKYTPVQVTQWEKWLIIGLLLLAVIGFSLAGSFVHWGWYAGAVVAGVALVMVAVSIVSTVAAVIFGVSLIAFIAGAAFFQFNTAIGLVGFALGAIGLIVDAMLVFL